MYVGTIIAVCVAASLGVLLVQSRAPNQPTVVGRLGDPRGNLGMKYIAAFAVWPTSWAHQLVSPTSAVPGDNPRSDPQPGAGEWIAEGMSKNQAVFWAVVFLFAMEMVSQAQQTELIGWPGWTEFTPLPDIEIRIRTLGAFLLEFLAYAALEDTMVAGAPYSVYQVVLVLALCLASVRCLPWEVRLKLGLMIGRNGFLVAGWTLLLGFGLFTRRYARGE